MRASEWEIRLIVIKVFQVCRSPRIFTMARCTFRSKAQLLVIWIGGLVVIILVTAHTSIWCIGVISVMAGSTIISY